MVRYLVVAAGAFAMMSSLAMAETTTTVVRSSPTVVSTSPAYVTPHKTTVVKRRINRYGKIVTVKRTSRDGFSGSSVSRTRSVSDPVTGETRSRTTTVKE